MAKRTYRYGVVLFDLSNNTFQNYSIEGQRLGAVKRFFLNAYADIEKRHHEGTAVVNSLSNHSFTYTDKEAGMQLFVYYNNDTKPKRDRFKVKGADVDYLSKLTANLEQGRKWARTKSRRFRSDFRLVNNL